MKSLNSLSYLQFEINERCLNIPMEEIVQQYDDNKFATNPYLFKILYIGKYNKKLNMYTVFLGPPQMSRLPIVKATIPLEIIRTNKLIPSYNYDRPLTEQELFIVNERVFRKISEINIDCFHKRKCGYYILCYGYLVNSYKDDDAMTKKTEGIQQFKLITGCRKKFIDRKYETSCYITNKLFKIFDIYKKLPKVKELTSFKELPDEFFIEKAHK